MDKHIAVLFLLCISTLVQANGWWNGADLLTNVMDMTGVTESARELVVSAMQLKETFTDKVTTISDNLASRINNAIGQVDWKNLYEFANNKMASEIKKELPLRTCVPALNVKMEVASLLLDKSIIRLRHDFTPGVRIINDADDNNYNIELYVEFKKIRLQYAFRYINNVVLYNLDKSGKLLLTQRKNIRVSLFGTTTKSLTQFKEYQKIDSGSCVVSLEKVNSTITGELEHTKIKYYSLGIGLTQRAVSGIITFVEDEIKEFIAKTLVYHIQKAVRKSKLFCASKIVLQELNCEDILFRNLVIRE